MTIKRNRPYTKKTNIKSKPRAATQHSEFFLGTMLRAGQKIDVYPVGLGQNSVSECVYDTHERGSFKRSATNKTSVYVRLGKKLGSI